MAIKVDSFESGNRRIGGTLAEINIIPLVDVTLVLLLIFMLTAPLMYRGVDVNLPKTSGKPTTVEERMVLTLSKDQNVYLNEKLIPMASLEQTLTTCSRTARTRRFTCGRTRPCSTGSSSRPWTACAARASRSSGW